MTVISRNIGNTMIPLGLATAKVVTPKGLLKGVVIINESEINSNECCYVNLVCADLTSNDLDKNDTTSLFYELTTASDTFAIDLYNSNGLVANLTDNSYGTLYNLGSISFYSNQSKLCGFIANWKSILTTFGEDTYYFKQTINGEEFNSLNYTLKQWSETNVTGYVLIESYMNGLIQRIGINLKGINARDCQRVKGFFGLNQPETVTTQDLFTSLNGNNREVVNRKTIKVDVYELQINPLKECFADRIINYHFFANEIYITDNNEFNYSKNYVRVKVNTSDSPKLEYPKGSKTVEITLKLKEAIQDNVKTNYF